MMVSVSVVELPEDLSPEHPLLAVYIFLSSRRSSLRRFPFLVSDLVCVKGS